MSGLESLKTCSLNIQEPVSAAPGVGRAAGPVADDIAAGPSLPQQHLDRALADFDREDVLPPVPDDPGIILMLIRNATLLVENGEYNLALNLLRNVLMRAPNHPDGLRWLGHCLRETGKNEEAEKCFRALVKRRPTSDNYMMLADILYTLGRDEEAMGFYHKTLQLLTDTSPRLFDVFKNLGNIHVRAGDFEAGEEFYNKAHVINPVSDTLMVNYGTLEIQRENLQAAVDRFREAVEINPNNDRGWVGLAMVHRQMGDLELSRANIERALDISPLNKTALNLLVEWNANDDDFGPSVRRLKEYLGQEGEDAEMSFLLAKILTHLNRLPEAMIEMERSLSLDPTLDGAGRLYETLRAEMKRRTEKP